VGRAALLLAGPGAVLSHQAAASLHEIRPAPPRPIDVSIPHSRRVLHSLGERIPPRRPTPVGPGRPARTGRAETVVDLLGQAQGVDRRSAC